MTEQTTVTTVEPSRAAAIRILASQLTKRREAGSESVARWLKVALAAIKRKAASA